ncbi:ras GEF [Delitschia confertaspora ATCC 74209]|uniref:Ras GEF n=1 Tax=Delitschia confertaspora ATCC 74209 TaxID=1513339 RepID=A0A9P4MRK2_9PLEO|nr:ras GEF [Delitschia confertaspora ATCC 74209]
MPVTGQAACSADQATQQSSRRSEKALRSRSRPVQRRESAVSTAAGSTNRPGVVKNRAYSAPMVPKTHTDGAEEAHNMQMLGEPGDDEGIADDPFFQRYNFSQVDEAGKDEVSLSSGDSSSDTEGPLSPTHFKARQASLAETVPSPRSPAPSSQGSESASTMQELNIAVLGARRSGKSTFTQRALNLQTTPTTAISTRKMTIDGGYYIVRLLEFSFLDIHIGERNWMKWPETIDDLATPRIDGVITVYDVTSHESLAQVPEMLNALSKAPLPFVLAACKCDQHPAHREVDPVVVEQKAKNFLGDIDTFQTSDSAPETQKRCLSVILRAAVAARRPRSQASTRRRANSSAVGHAAPRESWGGRGHERASSEFSASRFRVNEPRGHRYRSSETPGHTFLDLEESPGYDSNDSDAQTSDQEQSVISEQPSAEKGYTFDQLVDRLLAQPLSKNDSKFIAIFLALYRRFATPGQLLEAIIKRFEALKRDKNPQIIRTISQLRYLAVLQQWISFYPGDFAYPTTCRNMRKFVTALAGNPIFSIAAKEMLFDLEYVQEDDDTEWGCSDRNRDLTEPISTFHTVLDEDSENDDFTNAIGHLSVSSDGMSIARSMNTTTTRMTNSSTNSATSLHTIERNMRLAKQLVPNPAKPLSKVQWHQLMAEPEDSIARELTRIDWIMFSSIRPRDLVRHVSMNTEEKRRCKNLENVTRMTEHFNHLAYVVTNYILLRDKPKHRALMLEKWMKVARELRKLNNYNSLGAVLAGIKGTAVHRLVATRDLVSQAVGKDFVRLEILMGTQKSHFAYRLAWDNSSGERIPYVPLHRRDLVSASEGNSTFIGDKKPPPAFTPHPGVSVFQGPPGARDSREAPPGGVVGKERINWRKFEIMGEVIVGVQRAQGTPYPVLQRNDEVRNLVLDVKVLKDDDDLYARSCQLEAAGAGERRRFNWFRER